MPGLLFVHGGDEFARRVFREEGRGYWSRALPVVLEKHGYLEFSEAAPDALADRRTFQNHDVVLVARLPEEAWDTTVVHHAGQGHALTLAEGPLPSVMEEALGVRRLAPAGPEGEVAATDDRLIAKAAPLGVVPTGRLTRPKTRPIQRDPALDWAAMDHVPITDAQAEAWRATGWNAVKWASPGEPRPLATWRDRAGGARSPAIVKKGRLIGCSFGFFAFLGQRHTSEPFDGPEHRMTEDSGGVEALLLGLLDFMYSEAGATRARVAPWPAGAKWALNVRHDFDRRLSSVRVAATLRRHAVFGTAATWYWRARRASGRSLARVARDPRHEVALHTDRTWGYGGEAERARLEAAIGRPVRGCSAHGAADCFRFQGAPNVLWAQWQGFVYTELIQHAHVHPHRFAALGAEGKIEFLDVICLPHHESFELVYRRLRRQAESERVERSWSRWATRGGFMQVMNHPDRNTRELFRVLGRIPAEGRLNWTAAEAAEWWRQTHVATNLSLHALGGGQFRAQSRADVSEVLVELLDPSGQAVERPLDLEGGHSTSVR